jgi:hypothetical protein
MICNLRQPLQGFIELNFSSPNIIKYGRSLTFLLSILGLCLFIVYVTTIALVKIIQHGMR